MAVETHRPSSLGKITDGVLPMGEDGKTLARYVNRLKKLIVKNGYTKEFHARLPNLLRAIEAINGYMQNHGLEKTKELVKRFDKNLFQKKVAYQQLIYMIRRLKLDKNNWKLLFPSLVFGRLTTIQLGEIPRWHAPRKRRKEAKSRTIKTLPYFIAGINCLRESMNTEEEKVKFPAVISAIKKNIPFGSTAALKLLDYDVINFKRLEHEKERAKLDYCADGKISHENPHSERMAQREFCIKHQSYLRQFRHPELKEKNLKVSVLQEVKESSSSTV